MTGDGLNESIVKYYPGDTETVQLDGFPDGASVEITVEAFNQNGFVIRRGYSETVTIRANEVANALVTIFNVPVFTNIRPEAHINVERFVPKVFAPGGINFQLADTFGDITASLSDAITGEATFSITEDILEDSVKPVFISPLSAGEHLLTVSDPDTGETTEVEVTGYKSPTKKVLTTTAGAYLGVMGRAGSSGSNFGEYLLLMAE